MVTIFEKADYEILSVIKTNIRSYVYDFIDLGNADEHDEALKHMIDDSLYKTTAGKKVQKIFKNREKHQKKVAQQKNKKITSTNDDIYYGSYHPYRPKLLTLSTCRTSEGKDKRLLIIAIRSSDI